VPSPFDEFDDLLSDVALRVFGEEVILSPRQGAQYVERLADQDRFETRVRGVFSAHAAQSDFRGQARGGEFRGTGHVLSESSEFWISRDELAKLGFRPGRGDLLTLCARADQPTYAIVAAEPAVSGDLNLVLVREDVVQ
jgi:hypothetical protein